MVRRIKSNRPTMPRLFITILSYFMLLVLIVFAVSMSAYAIMRKNARAEFQEKNLSNLANAVSKMDSSVMNVFATGQNLLNDFYLQSNLLSYSGSSASQRIPLIKIPTVLSNTKYLVGMIDEILLIYEDDMLYCCDGTVDQNVYFSSLYVYQGIEPSFWKEQLHKRSFVTMLSPVNVTRPHSGGNSKKVLPILTTGYISGKSVLFVVNLDIAAMKNSFQQSVIYPTATYLAVNSAGETIFTNSSRPLAINEISYSLTKIPNSDSRFGYISHEGNTFFVGSTLSSVGNWTYYTIVPESEFASEYNNALRISLWICSLLILLSIALSFIFTYTLYSPMRNIMHTLHAISTQSANPPHQDARPFANIQKGVTALAISYRDLVSIMPDSLELSVKLYLRSMRGLEGNEEFIKHFWQMHHFDKPYIACVAVSFAFTRFFEEQDDVNPEDMTVALHLLIKESLNEDYATCVLEMESNCYVAFVNLPAQDNRPLRQTIEKLSRIFETDILYFKAYFGVSGICGKLSEANICYDHARTALEYGKHKGVNVFFAASLNIRNAFSYSFSDEERILRCLKTADMPNLNKAVQDMININILKPVSWRAMGLLLETMHYTGQRHFNGEASPPITDMLAQGSLGDRVNALLGAYQNMLAGSGMALDSDNLVIAYIRRYIDEHVEQNLSLTDIASTTGYHPKYVSRIFKSNIGYNLSDYINTVRIKKAKELILNTKLTMDEIQNLVGLPSRTTFVRVFKKYEGIPPSRYRQMYHIINNNTEETFDEQVSAE